MKILHTVYQLDKFSGAAFQAVDLCYWFNRNHDDISMKILNRTDKNHMIDCKGIDIKNVYGNIFRRICLVAKEIRKSDIIHMHGFNLLVYVLSIIFNKRIVLKSTLLNWDDFESLLNRKYGFILKRTLKYIDVNNSLSKSIATVNRRYIDENKVVTIPNSVPLDTYVYNRLEDKLNNFVIVGAVVPRKRTLESIKYFIDNFSHLEGAKLFVVGPYGNDLAESDSSYSEMCLGFQSQFPDQIVFTGKIDKQNVLKLFKSCKAMLFFPVNEGFGSVIIESQISNCVPIVTQFGGVERDSISNGYNGFIIEELKDNIPLDSIERLLGKSNMSLEAYEKYNPNAIYTQYVTLYSSLMR